MPNTPDLNDKVRRAGQFSVTVAVVFITVTTAPTVLADPQLAVALAITKLTVLLRLAGAVHSEISRADVLQGGVVAQVHTVPPVVPEGNGKQQYNW